MISSIKTPKGRSNNAFLCLHLSFFRVLDRTGTTGAYAHADKKNQRGARVVFGICIKKSSDGD